MFKLIVSVSLLLVVACTSMQSQATEVGNYEIVQERVARRLLDEFERYLKFDRDDPLALKAAKKLKKNMFFAAADAPVYRAAKMYLYLNEFQQCDPQAIEYMRDIVLGRKYSLPGLEGEMAYLGRSKTRFERALQATLLRAGEKCKSYVETWFRQTENQLNPTSKKRLYEYLTHDLVKSDNSIDLADRVVDNILKDKNLSKQMSNFDDNQLYNFFYDNFVDNFIEPCKNYRDVMSPFMKKIDRLDFLFRKSAEVLFDKVSTDLFDAVSRFHYCEAMGEASTNLSASKFADKSVDKFNRKKAL